MSNRHCFTKRTAPLSAEIKALGERIEQGVTDLDPKNFDAALDGWENACRRYGHGRACELFPTARAIYVGCLNQLDFAESLERWKHALEREGGRYGVASEKYPELHEHLIQTYRAENERGAVALNAIRNRFGNAVKAYGYAAACKKLPITRGCLMALER